MTTNLIGLVSIELVSRASSWWSFKDLTKDGADGVVVVVVVKKNLDLEAGSRLLIWAIEVGLT